MTSLKPILPIILGSLIVFGVPWLVVALSQRPILATILGGVVLFSLLWVLVRGLVDRGSYNMDAHDKPGAFEPHLRRYVELSKLVLTLSAATIAFLFNFLANLSADPEARGSYSRALEEASPLAIGVLCLSVLFALGFILFQTYQYESYEQSNDRDTYTQNKYALTFALGYSGLFWFFFAYGYLAVRMIR